MRDEQDYQDLDDAAAFAESEGARAQAEAEAHNEAAAYDPAKMAKFLEGLSKFVRRETMTVQELIDALSKAKNKDAEVDVIDTEGNEVSLEGIFSVDEDADAVHIVVANPKL